MMEKYSVKLAQFEGPLDLLLHLVHKAKIELKDIFVSEITQQYLAYMDEIKQIDMDRASDFLNMAALLLYIKSRALLPGKSELHEEEEGYDPEAELIERLRTYQVYKEAAKKLAELEMSAKNVYYKLPEELFDAQAELVLEDADTGRLYEIFKGLLARKKEKLERQYEKVEIRKDSFSIRLQKKKIAEAVEREKRISFFSLFGQDVGAMEIAVTFIAMLEMWNVNAVLVDQKKRFGDIIITDVS